VRNKSDRKTGDGKPKTGDENRGIKVVESRPQESLARHACSTPDADLASALLSTFHLSPALSRLHRDRDNKMAIELFLAGVGGLDTGIRWRLYEGRSNSE
jgi:hypothetical protein